ncbi:hypothetical protein VW41_11415 [Klebsiella michiganensis]|nr:hypothetical protein VW41_11415 [Klebsiella michiganensis]
MLYNDEEYKLFSEELEGCSIGTVWSAMRADNFNMETMNHDEKSAYFFELLKRLMEEGKIKFGKHGEFLQGSIEDQIALFKTAFPKTENEWKAKIEDIWFYEEECPGGIVWIHENGHEDWT